MKKLILQVLITIACLSWHTGTGMASVVLSPHDFSSNNCATFCGSSTEVCIYCHTPHNAVITANGSRVPLWNRTLHDQDGYFTMYDSDTFQGKSSYLNNRPTGPSLLCLSCHDGVSTLGDVINYSVAPITVTPSTIKAGEPYPDSRNINIGAGMPGTVDLSNDHPVSFEYDDTLVTNDGGLRPPADVVSGYPVLKFYGNANPKRRLECTTCHDPHEYGDTATPSKVPFLRMSNNNSDMCRACHLK